MAPNPATEICHGQEYIYMCVCVCNACPSRLSGRSRTILDIHSIGLRGYFGSHSPATQRTAHVPLRKNAGSSKGVLPAGLLLHSVRCPQTRDPAKARSGPERRKVHGTKEDAQTSDWADQPGDYLTLWTFSARTPTRLRSACPC